MFLNICYGKTVSGQIRKSEPSNSDEQGKNKNCACDDRPKKGNGKI